ncbi:MAG: acyl-CoA dehydrogenase, partial [Parahaliea sp.]
MTTYTLSNEELSFLRESVRGFLSRHWPAAEAQTRQWQPDAIRALWQGLAEQGFTALGADPEAGGLRALVLLLEELGRAACPVNMPAAALANLALAGNGDDDSRQMLDGIASGQWHPCLSLGVFDGAPNACAAAQPAGELHYRYVEGAQSASHILVATSDSSLGWAAADTGGIVVNATAGLAQPSLCELRLPAAALREIRLAGLRAADLRALYQLLACARALGAARRGFELATEHALERVQFGQPIARFQAIQHKLADCLIRLDASGRMLESAANAFDQQGDWHYFAAAACSYASPALRQVSLETHHVLGAIGYAEEHEAPRHFRRCHADLARFGGTARARSKLARHLLDEGRDLPEYDIGEEGNAFRSEVRHWLESYWTPERRARHRALPAEQREFDPDFTAATGELGWHRMSWPESFGGLDKSPLEQLAMIEEIQRSGSPRIARGEIQAHALIRYGSAEQQATFLPRLESGEIKFCLGYSEPGAGSDLASLQTRAERDGDDWVINGQKLWTTFAEQADYLWLAARTDPAAKPPHAGISVFIVPMNNPGITIQPSMSLYGHNFCTEFLDNV